jgi:hypothetical protein
MTTSSRLAVAAALLLAAPAAAQADPMFGVRFGYYTQVADPFLGAELLFRIVPDLYLDPNVEAVLVGDGHYVTVNGDLHYDLPVGRHTFLWVGGGLAIVSRSAGGSEEGHTDLGLDLLAGLGARHGRVIPYVQAKVIVKDDSEFVIGVGLRF